MSAEPSDHQESSVLERLLAVPGPFTAAQAIAVGATYMMLRRWRRAGLLAHPVRGVYHSAALRDDLDLRIAILRLVVPPDAVVTDRTAGWLWGANMVLAPGDHLVVPAVSVFCAPGLRLRNGLVASGERRLSRADVADVGDLRVTRPLRTACDLGRLLPFEQALAAMDSLAGLRVFALDELLLSTERFKGYRGVVQLRTLAPLVDAAAGSPGESILRLRWLAAGLPRPQLQVPVAAPGGGCFYLDMGLPEHRFAAEYDGAEFHSHEHREHDEWRRTWLRDELGWTIIVARKENVHGRDQDAERVLRETWRLHPK